MDFAALKTATLDRLGLPSSDGMATDTTLGRAVNSAVQSIGALRSWPWLYDEQSANTTAENPALALPATASKVHFVSIGADVLDRRQSADLIRLNGGADAQSELPTRWAMDGQAAIILSPIPDAVYSVKFGLTLVETELSGSQTPLLPARFHDFIVVRAGKYVAARKRDIEMYKLLSEEEAEWRESLDRAASAAIGTLVPRSRQDWGI